MIFCRIVFCSITLPWCNFERICFVWIVYWILCTFWVRLVIGMGNLLLMARDLNMTDDFVVLRMRKLVLVENIFQSSFSSSKKL